MLARIVAHQFELEAHPRLHGSSITSMSESRLDVSTNGRRIVVAGEIDLFTAPELAAALEPRLADGVEIDMSQVTFIDSSGIREVIRAAGEARQAGSELVIVAPSDIVVKLLDIAGLSDVLVVTH